MRKWILISMLPIGMSLTGCVHHWSEKECQTNNMHSAGIMDGQNGKPMTKISQYQQDCAKFQISLASGQYRKGWRSGNLIYCQPHHIFEMAKSGSRYPSVCGQTTSRMASFQRGTHIYSRLVRLQGRVNHINRELGAMRRVRREYNQVLDDIARDRHIIANAKNKHKRKQARIDIRNKKPRLRLLRQQMRSLPASGNRSHLRNKKHRLQDKINRLNRQ